VLHSFVLKLMAKLKTQHAYGAAVEVTRLIFGVFLLARVVFCFIRNCPPAEITLSLLSTWKRIKHFQSVFLFACRPLGPFVFLNGSIVYLEVLVDDLDRYDLILVVRVGVMKRLGNCYVVHRSDYAGLNFVVYY
jgi:hypothetical protein